MLKFFVLSFVVVMGSMKFMDLTRFSFELLSVELLVAVGAVVTEMPVEARFWAVFWSLKGDVTSWTESFEG